MGCMVGVMTVIRQLFGEGGGGGVVIYDTSKQLLSKNSKHYPS